MAFPFPYLFVTFELICISQSSNKGQMLIQNRWMLLFYHYYMQCFESTIYWYIDCYIILDDTRDTSS